MHLSFYNFASSVIHLIPQNRLTNRLAPSPGNQFHLPGALICAAVIAMAAMPIANVNAETWTSLSGDRSIEAEMVGMWDNQVVLILPSGQRINVPINSFEASSRIQAGKIADRLQREREALTEEIKRIAAIEAAPAPDPIPAPENASEYSPPSADMGPQEAFDAIAQQIRNGHFVVIYDALPPKYRSQIDELAQLTSNKLEPQGLADSLNQIHRLADLIVTRQNWIRTHHRLHDPASDADDLTQIGEAFNKLVLPMAGLLRTALPADEVSLDRIRSEGFGRWLHERDEVISPYLAVLMDSYSAPSMQWSLLKTKDDTAILEKPIPQTSERNPSRSNSNQSRKIALKKVDGYWIPTAIADGFDEWVRQRTEELQAVEDASMNVSQWLGGQYVSVPTSPTRPTRNSEFDQYGDRSQYDDPSEYDEMEYMEDDFGGSSYPDDDMYGYSNTTKPKMIEPPAITAEMIGSVLQSVGGFVSMTAPLEQATDAASFHRAVDQITGSIEGILSMASGW
ncbi:hypothetical protein [Rhodopirellula sp. SWK7]|uniref:hypothetical protein n=1 Tax=Rhodopirellula sp. SWK7 TaxID=595460 RepID=UPI0002BF4D74|nr:hypothetical protein [Rhodopirellula sp. SWK7]EMI47147.1 putative secreted protein [Rhodopirellula sp. SWK7]